MSAHMSDGLIEALGYWDLNRDDIAKNYAAVLRYEPDADWPALNAAVLKRYSPSGLSYIKRQAWKLNERLAEPSS